MISYTLAFSTFLGVFPFDRKCRFSVKISIYSIVVLSAIFCQVFAFDRPHLFPTNLNVGWLVRELLNLKNKLIVIAVCAHLVKIIQKREAVTKMLQGVRVAEGLVPLTVMFAYHVFKIWFEQFIYETDLSLGCWFKILDGLVYNHPSVYLAVLTLQFCDWLNLSHRELSGLYCQMRKRQLCSTNLLVDNHARVTRFLKIANSLFGFQLLTACLVYGELMIVNLLMLIVGYLNNGGWSELTEVAISAVYDFVILSYLSNCCQKCVEIADEFNVELFRLMKHNSNLYCNDKVLLYVKMKRPIDFTACGFFSLGYPFLTSVAAAVTTYLVILLQFSLTNA